MENKIINLIEESIESKNFEIIENIYALYDQLQYSTNIKQMAEDVYDWLEQNFDVKNVIFCLFDISKNKKETILEKGEEFYFDDDCSHFFVINTHTNLNATISFSSNSKEHQDLILKKYDIIKTAFFQISPIIQNGILKKNYVDSSSLDSVTNVYNRNTLIENLHKHLNLSNEKSETMYFLFIGIDHFKAIIDEFNYDIGDKVLIELAKIIHSNINQFDMVARLNADEFLVTILSTEFKDEVKNMANQIINDFAKTEVVVNDYTNQTLKKTICIGLESLDLNEGKSGITDAIKNADIALYEAKNKGRSVLFDYADLKNEDTIELF